MTHPSPTRLRLATRGSRLARWQSEWVAARLREAHPGRVEVELVEFRTHGDRDRNSPLAAIGGAGLFTREIQQALLEGRADLAVHSLKDLPTQGPPELALAAVPPRESPADALIAPRHRTLDALPPHARVGTSSLRRRALLLSLRPDLDVLNLRGNVDTRLAHALDGRLDAVLLAEAGLHRLGLDDHVTERLGPPRFLPAPGQGALAVECRADAPEVHALLAPLDDPDTRAAVTAERTLLARLEGGCLLPLGALAQRTLEGLVLHAVAVAESGDPRVDLSVGPDDDPVRLGESAAAGLLERGAGRFLKPRP
jgi:hydroxymethylbilane synthase